MPSDISSRLEEASVGPSRAVDVKALWRTARRRTIIARAVTTATIVVGLAAPGAVYLNVSKDLNGSIVPAESPSSSSGREGNDTVLCDGAAPEGSDNSETGDADSCVPYDPSFARYRVTVPAEGPEIADKGDEVSQDGVVNGTLELSPRGGSACLTLTGLSFTEAYLTGGEPVATFLLAEAVASSICVDVPARDLGIVNGDPERFMLEVKLSSGDMVRAPLRYMDQSAPEGDCATGIHFSPIYLPWIEKGEDIPAPEVGATPGAKGTMSLWPSDEELFDSAHLSIFTTRESIRGTDSGVRLLDNKGYLDLYAGGAMAISWDLGTETCNRILLVLTPEEDTSERETETELRRIARSLQFGMDILGDGAASHELSTSYEFKPYPGSQWYGPDEKPVRGARIINVIEGPEHCDWQSAVILHIGWPIGHEASDSSEARQFLRDPEGVFPKSSSRASFDAEADLPRRARFTGYRTDFMELWLEPSDKKAAYLRFADHVERWPRATEVIACR